MGTNSSKPPETLQRQGSITSQKSAKSRRSSLTKIDQMENVSRVVSNLKNEIDIFLGNRNSSRYREFQKILATLAAELQTIKQNCKKQHQRDRCDEIQGQVQSCLLRLETKVSFNEQNQNLDLGSVESHSFIHTPTHQVSNQTVRSLDQIEHETRILEDNIKSTIDLEDYKQFYTHEGRIKTLYTDLEMLKIDDNTPLSDRKGVIGKRLIRCNNKIKKIKRGVDKKSQVSISSKSSPGYKSDSQELNQIDIAMSDLEIKALTFEGGKGDDCYKEIEQTLENYWTKIYSMDLIDDEDRNKRLLIIEKIKNTLQELKKRAEENENQAEAIKNIDGIDEEVQSLKAQMARFSGTSADESYIKLDQKLRGLWNELGDIDEPNEHVRRTKTRLINDIQHTLNRFSSESKQRHSQIHEAIPTEDEILQRQLVNQVEEFQNHWNQLNHNLEIPKLTNSECSSKIISMLEKIAESVHQKQNALCVNEKKKSVADKQNLFTSTYHYLYHAPDLLPPAQNASENEIKVQPGVKTIGEIQRVATEAKNLLQQIRQSNCLKNDGEYKTFESQLKQCRSNLDAVEYNKRSETIENNRRRASKTINEAIKALEDKSILKQAAIRSSKSQDFMDIDAEIQYFRQQIKNFSGVVKDNQYEKIKHGLSDSLNKLQIMDDVHISKQDSIRQIQQYHQELETKLAENQAKVKMNAHNAETRRQVSQEIKAVVEEVQKLKLQIERFTGVYSGILYKQIETSLKACLDKLERIDANGDEKLINAVAQTKEKIEKYQRILNDKSSKPQEEAARSKLQRQSQVDPDSPHYRINLLRDKLVVVKNKTEAYTGGYQDDQYVEIEKELTDCFQELKDINDKGHKSVIISKEQYTDYIEKLFKYFEEKTKIQNDNVTIQYKQTDRNFKIEDPTKELSAIEDEVKSIKERIDNFEDEEDCAGLNQEIVELTTKLENVQAGNVVHVREIKRRLCVELQDCGESLEQLNRQEQEEMKKIQKTLKEVEEVAKKVDVFHGVKNDEDYRNLDEKLILLTIKLDNTASYGKASLKNERKKVVQEIHRTMKNLSDKAYKNTSF